MTDLDAYHRYAIGACAQGGTEGVAVARFVRRREDPGAAEIAITVVDAWHYQGIGRALIERLGAAALRRGIDTRSSPISCRRTCPSSACCASFRPD